VTPPLLSWQVTQEVKRRERKGEINTRWRRAQDEYIDALKMKHEHGLFRDIIIEGDYDPLVTREAGTIRYRRRALLINV
jgi:hypothetical protein